VIYNISNYDGTYLLKLPYSGHATKDPIEEVLNAKCFDGKSFYEIHHEIKITDVY